MRAQVYLMALMLVGTAAAANLADPPTCTTPGLEAACIRIILGNIIVDENTPPAQFNNDSYLIRGSITVNAGGRAEFIGSTIQWADQEQPITVNAGGTLIIDGATMNGIAGGTPPVIRVEAGATLVVADSTFDALTLHVATDDATIEDSGFTRGNPSIRLVDSGASLRDLDFADNTVGLNVTGGEAQVTILRFLRDQLGIQLYMTQTDLDEIQMERVLNGIISTESSGSYTNMNLNDNSFPPDVGIDLVRNTGPIQMQGNVISDFGVGMRCTDATATDNGGNVFVNNGAGNVVC